jgi:succinoglycan biosynthesis protein ExoA
MGGAIKSISMLSQYIRQRDVALICTHGYRADIVGGWAARRCRVPVACFLRGWTNEDLKVRLYETLDRTLLPFADRLVALSETQAGRLRSRRSLAHKVRVVVNSVTTHALGGEERRLIRSELRYRMGFETSAPVVVSAGRLSPEKGAGYFIQSIPRILQQYPRARFVLFGDGPLRKELKEMSRGLGLGSEVRFAGFVPDFARLLPGADILVNPSLSEQMPNVVLEAMAAGVPVIATAVGGVPEICDDGTLVLLPPEDVSAISEAVLRLLSDPAQMATLGSAGAVRVGHAFSPALQQAQLHALYEDLIPSLEASPAPSVPVFPPAGVARAEPEALPFISVVVPVRNEIAHVGSVLDQLLAQDYPSDRYEILVVDGGSIDGTIKAVEQYVARFREHVRLLHNPARLSSAGRNVGIRASRGELTLFVDGHCQLESTKLLAETARTLRRSGADCLCRPQPLTAPGNTRLQNVIAHARATAFGHGRDSTIYRMDHQGFINPTSSGATYRRSVFDRVGTYDERFDACEDVEFNYRVFKAGLRAYSSPGLAVYYQPRPTLAGLFKQLARYGRGRFRFMMKHHDVISVSQLVPPAFLAGLVLGSAAAYLWTPILYLLLGVLGFYALLLLGFSVGLAMRHGWEHLWASPLVLVTIHLALGVGFWEEGFVSLARGASVVKRPVRVKDPPPPAKVTQPTAPDN